MRALVTRLLPDGKREKVLVQDWPDAPEPGPAEVRVQTLYSGLTNGTERNDILAGNYSHPDSALPRPMGYQNVGRIVSRGSNVTGFEVGDLVYSGTWLASDHCEFVTVPAVATPVHRSAAEARTEIDYPFGPLIIKLPDSVDPVDAALFGMASVATRVCRTAQIALDDKVLIVGQGGIGLLVGQVACAMGARVTVCDTDDGRLALSRKIVAAEAWINTKDDAWDQQIAGQGFDVVIDAAGVRGMEDRLIEAARRRGRVMFVAGRARVDYDFNLGQMREINIRQMAHFDATDLSVLCNLVAQGRVRIRPIIKDIVPVAQADDIYRRLRDDPISLMGTVFVW